uniref:Uncharacterized protein n=1 Tax=Setaria digitata TaxID=48799 RepID=A0A915PEW6_9BILA
MVTTRNRKRTDENNENKNERNESHRNGEQTVAAIPSVSASNEEGELVENENGSEKRDIAAKAGTGSVGDRDPVNLTVMPVERIQECGRRGSIQVIKISSRRKR